MKRVFLKGPVLSQSGYGDYARSIYRALKDAEGVELYIQNIPWGKTSHISEDYADKKELQEKHTQTVAFINHCNQNKMNPGFDVSFQVTIPNEWERVATKNIGVTAGIEVDKISPVWVEKSALVDKIIVCSEFAKSAFDNTSYQVKNNETGEVTNDWRCRTPVEVVPIEVEEVEADGAFDPGLDPNCFNFLSVAQWGPRKNLDFMIKGFLDEFKNEEKACLVLKTNVAANSIIDRESVTLKLKGILNSYPDRKCKIKLIHGNLTRAQMASLYQNENIHAFVTTTHGEGFGLPIYEAARAGVPVIAPKWSAHTEFLTMPEENKGKIKNKYYALNVDYDIKPIENSVLWKGVYEEGAQWCYPRMNSYRDSLRKIYKNQSMYKGRAEKLARYINSNKEDLSKAYLDLVNTKKKVLKPEPVRGISFCIPTNGRRKEKTNATIKSIKRQNWGDVKYEIIICGDVSSFKESDELRLIDKADEAHSKKVSLLRNAAAEEAMFENIAFCDDDIVLENHWLENTMKFSETNGWEILGNKILNPDGTRHWDKALLSPRVLVDYDHSDYDSRLMQTSGFFLMRKSSFVDNKWDETKLVYADREQGGIPEDVQFNLDFKKKDMVFRFNDSSTVWHNDDTYTEFGQQTLKKELIEEKTGMANFLSESEDFLKCLNSL